MMFGLGKFAAVAATVIGLAAGSASAYAAEKDIVDTAVAAGQFKTLAAALTAAGLVDTLKGPGPFTVFAPTDAAFAKLPAGTVDTLLRPENKAKLTAILAYHVVPGNVMAADVVKLTYFVTDMALRDHANAQFIELWPEPRPARTVVGVDELPRGAVVEIDAVAKLP